MSANRAAALAPLVVAVVALAAPGEVVAGLRHASALGIRNDRLGLGVFSDTAWRFRLFESDHVLLRDTTLDLGVVTQLSPATLHPGVFVEVVPVAVLKLRASVQRLQYFGWFGSLSAYPDGNWSPAQLTESSREHSGARAGGYLFDARAMLRGKVWRIVFSLEGQRSRFDFEAKGPVHEPVSDLLVGADDALTQVRATLGFVALGEVQRPGSLMVAGLHQYFRTDETDVVRHLPGLALVAKPPSTWWSTGDPTLAVLGGVFAVDPYREGDPYIGSLLTLTFSEDP
jgi:hypothetical protein